MEKGKVAAQKAAHDLRRDLSDTTHDKKSDGDRR